VSLQAGTYYRFATFFTLDSVTFSNTFYISPDSDINSEDIPEQMLQVGTILNNSMQNFRTDTCLFSEITLSEEGNPQFPTRTRDMGNLPGINNGEALPTNSCVVVREYAQVSVKTRNGRVFLRGIPVSFMEQGRLTDNSILAFAAFVDQLKAPFSTSDADWTIGNFSRLENDYFPIFRANVDPIIKSYRRSSSF
jgi:hypothetical protein